MARFGDRPRRERVTIGMAGIGGVLVLLGAVGFPLPVLAAGVALIIVALILGFTAGAPR